MKNAMLLFTGGYTEPILQGTGEIVQGRAKGIASYEFDAERGTLKRLGCATGAANPSFVLADPNAPYLYCANELKEHAGVGGSTVSAYAITQETGELRLLNRQAVCGEDACFLCLAPDGRHLIAENYSGGSVCVLPVNPNHSLGAASCLFKHAGSGPNPVRQASPHPHQAIVAPDGEHIYVSDLGLDCLKCYRADWKDGWLTPEPAWDIRALPGQGPRHAAFNASGDMLYVITELSCEVNVYTYDSASGRAELVQRASLLRAGAPACLGAEIHLHPSGRWLYCSLRSDNCICQFDVQADGRLALVQRESTCGEGPRDFTLSPDGRWLLAANQDTDSICVFRVDPATGQLQRSQLVADAPCVTTLAFWQR